MTTHEPRNHCRPAPEERPSGALIAWLGGKPLASRVLDAVKRVDGRGLVPIAPAPAGVAFQPRMLLALVVYCYADGLCGSQEIEALMCGDANFRFLCGNEFPRWQDLRRFRRHNRAPIRRCLGEVLGGLAAESEHGDQLADARLEKAVFLDCMALDD